MERIRICVLFFRIRIYAAKYFFNLTILSLSLSPPIFGNSIATILFFFFLPFSAIPLPQINFSIFFFFNFGNLATTIPFFFSPIFGPNFCNLVVTIPFFSLLFPPLQFRQLGCYNCFFPFKRFSPSGTSSGQPDLGSRNFGNLITKIQILSHFNYHIISLSSLILFVRISVTVLPKLTYFFNFLNNFQQFPYHKQIQFLAIFS